MSTEGECHPKKEEDTDGSSLPQRVKLSLYLPKQLSGFVFHSPDLVLPAIGWTLITALW